MQVIGTVSSRVLREIQGEMAVRNVSQMILIFGMGSQFDQLIGFSVAAHGVYYVYGDPTKMTVEDVRRLNPQGIILSGGPGSVVIDPPKFDAAIFRLGIPILGVCLGFQMWAHEFGAEIRSGDHAEYGVHSLRISDHDSQLLENVLPGSPVLQSHRDVVVVDSTKPGWEVAASTDNCTAAVARYDHCYGVQFHPETSETEGGRQMYANFCFLICGITSVFAARHVTRQKIIDLKRQIKPDQKVLLCLSGGCDSSITSELLHRVYPEQIWALYIQGIDRPDDEATVQEFWGDRYGERLIVVDATDDYLKALAGQLTWPDKRTAVRYIYLQVIEKVIAEIGADFVAQGTLYTDITESGGGHGTDVVKHQIKQHHNVDLGFSVPEILPLADCHKDSARQIGYTLGMPRDVLERHPFPGPGLVVRVDGEITAEKLAMARQADGIFMSELRAAGLYESVWQAGASLLDSVRTTTKGDEKGEGRILELWAVNSVDGHTARTFWPPEEFVRKLDTRINNEVPGIGSTNWRITGKPPATIELG